MTHRIDEGSHIIDVRIKHFLGVLYDYAHIPTAELERLAHLAREREKQGVVARYSDDVNTELKKIARLLS